MENKIKVSVLQEALLAVKPALASKDSIEQASSFAFIGDRVVTYNEELGISYPLKTGIVGAVHANELYEFLKKLSTEEVTYTVTEKELLLKSGRARVGLVFDSEIKLPLQDLNLESIAGGWKGLPGDFLSDLKLAASACGNVAGRPVLASVNVQRDRLQSSDSYSILEVLLGTRMKIKTPVLLSAHLIPAICQTSPVEYVVTDEWFHFRTATGLTISARLVDGEYPDVSRHLDVIGDSIELPPTITGILDRALVFAKRTNTYEEVLTIRLENSRFIVESRTDVGSWFMEECKVKYTGGTRVFMITPYLLQRMVTTEKTFVVNDSVIMFQGGNWKYIAQLLQVIEPQKK